ncbi:MAG: hypothetical protein AMS27_12325 [Bacteroides sp. SM23_62_1]|nr:MAG: hypothetical protein AMS27_12325 [Bacteroides sp. SM23_62_1]
MDPFFVKTFWITVGMLWIALIILYFILTDRSSLERKGYNEKYISYLRKSHLIRICLIAVVLPLLILMAAFIVSKITGPLQEEVQLAYIVIILMILVIPFKYFDDRINQKRIRELALDTKEKIAIDLRYKTLHLIFKPWWEIVLGAAALAYGILVLKIEQWIIYLFLLFPWLIYLTTRGTRYQTRPYLKDNYKYLFSFNLFSFIFFLFYFCAYFIMKIYETFEYLSAGEVVITSVILLPRILLLSAGLLIIICLTGRIAIYISNYRLFNNEMNELPGRDSNPLARKLVFFFSALLILFTFSGVALLTGMFKVEKTDVGIIKKKYLIEKNRMDRDTVAIFDQASIYYLSGDMNRIVKLTGTSDLQGDELDRLFHRENMRMFCTVEICKTNRIRDFEICCRSTFDELPFESRVKFVYRPDHTITRLIDY